LKQLVSDVFHKEWNLLGGLLIEFNNDILYEAGEDIDEDDAEMYGRRLKKSLSDLKIKDLAIMQV